MHELSMVSGILRLVQETAREHHAQRIVRVRVALGLLACVEAQTLSACFDIVAEGTIAEGATLEVDIVPLSCTCTGCGHMFELTRRVFVCPACASFDITFEGGHGCRLMAIEAAEEHQHG